MNEVIAFPEKERLKTPSEGILAITEKMWNQGAAGKVRKHLENLIFLSDEIANDGFELTPEISLEKDGAAGHVLVKLSPLNWSETLIEIPVLDEYFDDVPDKPFSDIYPDMESIQRAYITARQKAFEIVGNYTLRKKQEAVSVVSRSEELNKAA